MNPYLAGAISVAAYLLVGYTIGYQFLTHIADRSAHGQYEPDDIMVCAGLGLIWPISTLVCAIWWTFSKFTDLLDGLRGRR